MKTQITLLRVYKKKAVSIKLIAFFIAPFFPKIKDCIRFLAKTVPLVSLSSLVFKNWICAVDGWHLNEDTKIFSSVFSLLVV